MEVNIIWHDPRLSPNSIMLTFTETSPRRKLRTRITKVTNANDMSWQVRDKPVCVALIEFGRYNAWGKSETKSVTKSVDFVVDTNHESRWHVLCRGLSWFVTATFPTGKFWWKSQSRRNGIWALLVTQHVGTNLIHDFTAVTFSVKLTSFREKRWFPRNPWFFVNFSAFSLIYDNSRVLSAAFVRMLLFATCRTLALSS